MSISNYACVCLTLKSISICACALFADAESAICPNSEQSRPSAVEGKHTWEEYGLLALFGIIYAVLRRIDLVFKLYTCLQHVLMRVCVPVRC